jgi:hypothetical protein
VPRPETVGDCTADRCRGDGDLLATTEQRYGWAAEGMPNIWTLADAKSDIRTLPSAAS